MTKCLAIILFFCVLLVIGCTDMTQREHTTNAALIAADDGRPDDIINDFDKALGR